MHDPALFIGIFKPYFFILTLLMIVAFLYFVHLITSNWNKTTVIYLGIILIYDLICYIWIIPFVSSYLSVLWLYVPLIVILYDIVVSFLNKNSNSKGSKISTQKFPNFNKAFQSLGFHFILLLSALILFLFVYRVFTW